MTHPALFLTTALLAALLPAGLFAEDRMSAGGEPLTIQNTIATGDPRDGALLTRADQLTVLPVWRARLITERGASAYRLPVND